MSRINIPFVGASNKSRSVEVSTQRSVNLFPELDPLSGFQQALYLRPQLASFSTAGSATIRGMATFGSLLFVVSGGTVYSIDSSGSATSRGNLLTSTGRVSIDQNATQLMFVDGTAGYIWDGSTLTQIADGDFPNGATQVVQFDGYFVVNDPANPGRFYISAYNNGTAWDATEFATAERNPDGLLAMLVNERELWLWGIREHRSLVQRGRSRLPVRAGPVRLHGMGRRRRVLAGQDQRERVLARLAGHRAAGDRHARRAHQHARRRDGHRRLCRHLGCLRLLPRMGRAPVLRADLPDRQCDVGVGRILGPLARVVQSWYRALSGQCLCALGAD
jgi:hypothetical protein